MGCQSLRGELASAPTRARTSTERLQSQTEQRADGVKAVSRRRRGRVAPALSPADHWSTSAQLLPGDRAFLSPSPAVCLRTLDASVGASGPHNFAVRVSAFRQARRPRPLHPAPTSVTIAKRPFGGTGWQSVYC